MSDAIATPPDDWESLLIRDQAVPPEAEPTTAQGGAEDSPEPGGEAAPVAPAAEAGPDTRTLHISRLTLGVLLATVAVAAWALGAAMHGSTRPTETARPTAAGSAAPSTPVLTPPPPTGQTRLATPAAPMTSGSGSGWQSGTPAATRPSAQSGDLVWVTKSGRKYHAAGCRHARAGTAIPRSDAIARGYTPCSQCKP
jgi:hypothetical protein